LLKATLKMVLRHSTLWGQCYDLISIWLVMSEDPSVHATNAA
jgi:hypothetical protein